MLKDFHFKDWHFLAVYLKIWRIRRKLQQERKLVLKLSTERKSLQNIAKTDGESVNCVKKSFKDFKKTVH